MNRIVLIDASEVTVKRRFGELKEEGIIKRVGSKKTGHWEVIEGKG